MEFWQLHKKTERINLIIAHLINNLLRLKSFKMIFGPGYLSGDHFQNGAAN
jgi:hypothetical protein